MFFHVYMKKEGVTGLYILNCANTEYTELFDNAFAKEEMRKQFIKIFCNRYFVDTIYLFLLINALLFITKSKHFLSNHALFIYFHKQQLNINKQNSN